MIEFDGDTEIRGEYADQPTIVKLGSIAACIASTDLLIFMPIAAVRSDRRHWYAGIQPLRKIRAFRHSGRHAGHRGMGKLHVVGLVLR